MHALSGEQSWDLKNTDQPGQFTFYDAPAGASEYGKPLDIGDFDRDGCGDIAVAASSADVTRNGTNRPMAGHVRIIMDVCDIAGTLAMEQDGEQRYTVVTVYGGYGDDMVGTEVYVGDVNGDTYDDLLIGAQNQDGPNQNRYNAGAAYLVPGNRNFESVGDIDLRTPPENVITIYGATARDRLGIWVDGGDFDGDGIGDLLQNDRLARLGWGNDQPARPLANRRDQINGAH